MTKTFKEVFPTLKLDKDMENLLENADVTRISVNHARDFYKIYVKAKRLIFKKNIWKLEESIKKQIFKRYYSKNYRVLRVVFAVHTEDSF